MYATVTFLQDPSVTDELKITTKIPKGKFKLYQAYSGYAGETYALKMFPKNAVGTRQFKKEAIVSDLSHPNIIKYIPAAINFTNSNHFHCILTEFAEHGDLLDMVLDGIFTSEILVRTYFQQLVAGVEYIHSQGVAHLDLKLENLMLGSGYTLKIIDFDQAQRIKEKKLSSGGTPVYRAPEIIDGSCKDFKAADIYSLGIILYAMKAQGAPFHEDMIQDAKGQEIISLKYYDMFLEDNAAYWMMKANEWKNPAFFSPEFKRLVNGMLQFDVSKRFTLEDVKNSDWFKGPVLSQERLKAEMRARRLLYKRK